MITKIRLISKFTTSGLGWQRVPILVLPNISRSKVSQTMKFVQLIENTITNVFLDKSNTKCGGETIPRPFSKKEKLSTSLGHILKYYNLFLFYAQIEVHQNILKLRCFTLSFILYKVFSKNKKRSGASLPTSFSAWFSFCILLTGQMLFFWLHVLPEILVNMVIAIVC